MVSILKSLWARLAGAGAGGGGAPAEEPRLDGVEYKGYRIRHAPYAATGGYQTCGIIEKGASEGPARDPRFAGAETHPSRDEAATFAIAKGKQIIDQQGERMFGGG